MAKGHNLAKCIIFSASSRAFLNEAGSAVPAYFMNSVTTFKGW